MIKAHATLEAMDDTNKDEASDDEMSSVASFSSTEETEAAGRMDDV